MRMILKNEDGIHYAIVSNGNCGVGMEYFYNGKLWDIADYQKLSHEEQKRFDKMADDFEEGYLNYFDGCYAWCHNPHNEPIWNVRARVMTSYSHNLLEM